MTTIQFPFLLLPPELRLQIYEYILDIPTPYTSLTQYHKPLIVINDTGNQFTTRPTYRALHISPKWVGISDGNRKTLSLLSVNRQIHAEVEDFLYTTHTLFFLNGFDLDHLGEFLDTLSPTARRCIRNIGFEVYLVIHNNDGSAGTSSSPPKRSFRQYERAAAVLREKLPSLRGVVFYLDPWFSACCDDGGFGPWTDERTVLARGVGFLIRAFGAVKMKGRLGVEMDFLPTNMRLFGMRARAGTGIDTGTGTRDNLLRVR